MVRAFDEAGIEGDAQPNSTTLELAVKLGEPFVALLDRVNDAARTVEVLEADAAGEDPRAAAAIELLAAMAERQRP